jgi:PKD repeat protein/Tol biopolymer transport system component
MALCLSPPVLAAPTTRVSVSSDGMEGDGASGGPAISADGRYVAFTSAASNLVSGDTNAATDIFVRDLLTGQTARVSVASDGTEGNGGSFSPAISADGRYVAFESCASNLVAGDTNDQPDVFVHNRQTGGTERVSVASDGSEADACSWWAALSADGRYVAFASCASNLVDSDTNDQPDVFVHDRQTGQTERVSVTSEGGEADACSCSAAISADGRYVAFPSCASNLVAGDSNQQPDIFVHDRQTGQTERVSVASDGSEADGCSWSAAVSADGGYAAFASCASNLVAGDTSGQPDIFVHDRQTGHTERASVTSEGNGGSGCSDLPAISADGRYVAFLSYAPDLVADDANGVGDIFIHDLATGHTERVSVASDGTEGNADSLYPAVSANGRYAAFQALASNLVAGDTNDASDVFVRERPVCGFSGSPSSGYGPLTVDFTDVSTGGVTGWEWDFGDGNTSTEQNPSHQYSAPGSYTVALTVTDGVACDTETKADYITVPGMVPVADFCGSPTSGTVPLEVTFTDLSTGDPTSWSWDFGDGGTSAEQNPTHEYTGVGHFTVSLTAGNAGGSDTETKTAYITTTPPAPIADFSAAPLRGKGSLLVNFTDLSTNTPTSWEWDFGDGSASTQQDPNHQYTSAGAYTVTLTAANAGGSDITTKERYIKVSFSDVPISPADPADYWALDQILACVEAGVVSGYPDGTYRPTDAVDRGQMAVYISRGLVAPSGDAAIPSGPAVATFPDVPTDHWAFQWVEFAVAENIVAGYPDGTYRPDEQVDRGQMAVYVARALVAPSGDAGVPDPPEEPTFPDVTSTNDWAWCYPQVEFIFDRGVTQGYDDGQYHPERIVTRDQMAVYVQRAFDLPV